MAVELAAGYVSATVKLEMSNALGKAFDSAQKQALGAGKKTGEAYTKGLESELKDATAQVKKFTDTVVKSRDKEADAAGKLKVATEQLNEARDAGVKGSKLTRLEEQRESLLRKQTAAAKELARETDALAQAEKRRDRATASLRNPKPQTQAFVQQFSRAGTDSGRAFTQAASRQMNSSGSGGLPAVAGGLGGKLGKAFMGAMAAAVSAAAVGSILKDAITTGLDFERVVNSFVGVTNSGAVGADAMREAARALGTDINLAGVSASDAAAAMLELAKGGFTAQQAMDAARGTLQLATAGQIDAAEAAAYQSAAINTFQLQATDAGRVADLLAAAANASSADVSDLGQALQQGGSVAAGFGVSIEDTLTALTLFSKWGINGSDAGTMLKTSLQAITDQGKPAQGAIDELGLTLYDAQGRFVGVESMMKQVADASKRMTQEQFQAATAVLFGSDAMRASMVAANGGAAAWDETSDAVNRSGAAADMAAAQMKGLPGVVESFSNVWEGFKLQLFDIIDGPLIAIGNWFLDLMNGGGPEWLQQYGDTFTSVFAGIGEAIGPAREGLSALGDAWKQYVEPAISEYLTAIKGPLVEYGKQWVATFKEAMPILKAVGMVIGGVLLGALKAFTVVAPIVIKAFTGIVTVARNVYEGIKAGAEVVGTVGSAMKYVFDTVLVPIWQNFQLVVSTVWGAVQSAITTGWSVIEPVFDALKTAFQSVADVVSSAWSGLGGIIKSAFDGIMGAIRGPVHALGSLLAGIPDSFGPFQVPGAEGARSLGQRLQAFRSGGTVRGPGTGTSDSILALLSDGEGILTAKAMGNGGAQIMTALNAGWVPSVEFLRGMLPGFAGGGLVRGVGKVAEIAADLGLQLTSGRRNEPGSYHGTGQAGDFSNGVRTDQMLEFATYMAQNYGSNLSELIYDDPRFSMEIKDGKIVPRSFYAAAGDHTNHVHVAVKDDLPLGNGSLSPLSSGSGSLGASGSGSSGGSASDRARKAADKQIRIDQLNDELAAAEQALAEAEANADTKESTLMTKRNAVQKKKDAIAKAERELDEIKNSPVSGDGGGQSSGSDPFSKILDGVGDLAQVGVDGLVESFLPPGFSNPMEWGITNMAGGLLNFVGGLMPDPVSRGIFGALGAGITGDAKGATNAIGGIFQSTVGGPNAVDLSQPGAQLPGIGYGDMGSAFADGSAGPQPGGGDPAVDQSIHVGENASLNMDGAMDQVRVAQNQQVRRNFGTARPVYT